MSDFPVLTDPADRIWGFHVHMELPLSDFRRALVIQQATSDFLMKTRGLDITRSDVFRPGYGPHLEHMWELRLESIRKGHVLVELGIAIGFMAVNRFSLAAYVHPTMHDESKPLLEQLREEGELNQKQAVWFGSHVEQNQDFFFRPPIDPVTGSVLDTRTSQVFTTAEIDQWRAEGEAEWTLKGLGGFRDPSDVVIRGFHVHVDFTEDKRPLGDFLFAAFVEYMAKQNITPSSTRHYAPKENGPHQWGGWEFKLEYRTSEVGRTTTMSHLGVALGWLMCNRQDVRVFAHAVSWEEGDFDEELKAHEEYAFFMGDQPPPLDLGFFRILMAKKAAAATHATTPS